MLKKSLMLIVVLGFIASCATIMKGTKQTVTINSNVSDAEIFIDGTMVGRTPFTGEIPRGKKLMTVKKSGYKDYTQALSADIESIFWGNIIIGGVLGSTTDFSTGAMYAYSPVNFQVDMMKNGMALNDFKKEFEVRKFAMVNMSNIALDLSNNEGNYLTTLLSLSNKEVNPENIAILKDNIVKSNGNQISFGNLVVSQL